MERLRLVLLFSNWYSGATIATIFLNSHPKIVSNGEAFPFTSTDYSDYICSCGKRLQHCDFYAASAAHMRLKNGDWDRRVFAQLPTISNNYCINKLFTSPKAESVFRGKVLECIPIFRNRVETFQEAHFAFARNAVRMKGAHVYLDGTKSIARGLILSNDSRYSIKAIHMIRDGRAFCFSYMKNMHLSQDNKSIARSARVWLNYIDAVKRFQRLRPNIPFLDVRYEDLCKQPDESLNKLLAFMGVSSRDVSKPALDNRHILGNMIRNSFDGEIRYDRRWESEFSKSTKEKIKSRLKGGLREFNYID